MIQVKALAESNNQVEAKAKIQKVMESNLLFTLFFDDNVKIEIYKSKFRNRPTPHKGDLFTLIQEKDAAGTVINTQMLLNGVEIQGEKI